MSIGDGKTRHRRLFFFVFGEQVAEAVQLALPDGAPALNPFFGYVQAGSLDPARAHAAGLFGPNEVTLFQHLQVLHDRGERNPQRLSELRHGNGSIPEPLQDRAAGGIAQSVENPVDSFFAGGHGYWASDEPRRSS